MIVLFISFILQTHPSIMNQLAIYEWKYRILLISDYTDNGTMLEEQKKMIAPFLEGIRERKLIIAVDTQESAYWITPPEENSDLKNSKPTLSDSGKYKVQLIGLDGGIKFSSDQAVGMNEIFGRIDAMPIRRMEMEKENGNN